MNSMSTVNRLVIWCILVLSFHMYADIPAQQENKKEVNVQNIQKRFYLIQRLDKPLHILFSHVCNDPACIESLIISDSRFYFKHPVIKNELHEMALLHSIEPMYRVWNDILSYKYIDDDLFMRETIVALIMMYKNLLSASKEVKRTPMCRVRENSIGIVYDATDITYQKELSNLLFEHNKVNALCQDCACENDNLDCHIATMSLLLEKTMENQDFVSSNVTRFYSLKRLMKPVYLLSRLCSPDSTMINTQAVAMPVKQLTQSLKALPFTHPIMLETIQQINALGSLKPFFSLWRRINSYDFIEDELIVREFGQMLVVMYNACILHSVTRYVPVRIGDSLLQNILVLYQKISALPIMEIFMVLDEFVERVEGLVHDYQIADNTMSWQIWIKKYWWTAPVTIVALLFTYTKMFFGRRTLQPRTPVNSLPSMRSCSINEQRDVHESLLDGSPQCI